MRELLLESLRVAAEPLRGASVLMFGFSGRGFPGGDSVAEAAEVLPLVGIDAVYSNERDTDLGTKLARSYDVSIVCNTRVGAVLEYDQRVWSAANVPV